METMKKPQIEFEFGRYNPRRAMRGAEAVQIRVLEDGEVTDFLWMSESDIKNNIKDFGESPALSKGLECYRTGKEPV